MATSAGPLISTTVTAAKPSGAPAATFADRGPDGWEILYSSEGGDLTLTASVATPAVLWAWDTIRQRWRVLEEAWRTDVRVVEDGDDASDAVTVQATVNIGAVAVQYPGGIVSAGLSTFLARTIRNVGT